MLFSLLAFGTLWFWAALIIPFLFLIYFVENEKSVGAFLLTFFTLGALIFLGGKNVVPWVTGHPFLLAEYVGAYIGVGIVWGFIKWFFYVLRKRDAYTAFRADWVKTNGEVDDSTTVSGGQRNHRSGQTNRQIFQDDARRIDLPPRVERNKGRIIFWMSYWPASALWTLLNDPITRIGRFIYNRVGHLFQKMSDAMFSKYSDDFK